MNRFTKTVALLTAIFQELDDELNLLQKNGIAIESFFIPPPNSLKRSDLYTKIFHPNLPS